ncbi:unnamed protein product [Lepeophtheirus salmonis]|uniref:(salmon louse) hypothetical protein n=1 Tax=Lepeophtheirus salmonis TaxID=72036 RepID=A0A0K2TXK1_LEPSM|nr:unnamed protein product [Lepeophtheirus salmonis]CAF2897376.1 unnamed protein product [Lepeophtheirus salmonis]
MEIVRGSTINFTLIFCLLYKIIIVQGHGRLIQPPSRASMWRYGFVNPKDYNDNEGFCGGLQKMIDLGGCGVCGDSLDVKTPRPHEAGGKYGNGILVEEYMEGSTIPITVQVTSNHKGYFTFKMCPNNNVNKDPDQSCFDQYVLTVHPTMADYYVLPDGKARNFKLELKLPKGLICNQCILQWTYTAGNNWGVCEDGSQALGCGIQEQFRACSDVSIVPNDGSKTPLPTNSSIDPRPTPTTNIPTTVKLETTQTTKRVNESSTPIDKTTKVAPILPTTAAPESGECRPVGIWVKVAGMTEWCKMVCTSPVPFCPESHCVCA